MAAAAAATIASKPPWLDKSIWVDDPVFGLFEISAPCAWVVAADEFTRLENIGQLGVSPIVFPTAKHTRYQHSLGVAHLARTAMRVLRRNQPELELTARHELWAELAGLVHDIGHGPFSHSFDHVPTNPCGCHEARSQLIFKMMCAKYAAYHNLTQEDIDWVCWMIDPQPNTPQANSKYAFLGDIIANKHNTVDVDKMDYLRRDAHYLKAGNMATFVPAKIIGAARVINGQWSFDLSTAKHVLNIPVLRTHMHDTYYRCRKSLEWEATFSHLMTTDPEWYRLVFPPADKVGDMAFFCTLSDRVARTKLEQLQEPLFEYVRQVDAEASSVTEKKEAKHADQSADNEIVVKSDLYVGTHAPYVCIPKIQFFQQALSATCKSGYEPTVVHITPAPSIQPRHCMVHHILRRRSCLAKPAAAANDAGHSLVSPQKNDKQRAV